MQLANPWLHGSLGYQQIAVATAEPDQEQQSLPNCACWAGTS